MQRTLLALIIVGLLVGCTAQPLLNLYNEPIPTPIAGETRSLEVVGDAIMAAATQRGWAPRHVKPGVIAATLFVRGHRADIEIPYSQASYSIRYVDSVNLGYDGTNIHRTYNGWVIKLSDTIQKEIYLKSM